MYIHVLSVPAVLLALLKGLITVWFVKAIRPTRVGCIAVQAFFTSTCTYVHVVVHVLSLIAVWIGFSSPQDLWSPGALKE